MSRLNNGYTKYYNHKNDRSGVLFQGVFKSVHVESNEQLLYVSVYVNKNHFIHGYESNGRETSTSPWQYSSLPDYIGRRDSKILSLCDMNPILNQFKNAKEYEKFVRDNALYMEEKKKMDKYFLE